MSPFSSVDLLASMVGNVLRVCRDPPTAGRGLSRQWRENREHPVNRNMGRLFHYFPASIAFVISWGSTPGV
jgi:hypothetical protein